MIARVWKARAQPAGAGVYRRHFESRVLAALNGVEGYLGATLLTRALGDNVEIVVLSRWRSLDSVRAFAGADLEHAVVAEEIRPHLTAWDDRVQHYEVAIEDCGTLSREVIS
jgi:heme-degrading monooxygenase HmoA